MMTKPLHGSRDSLARPLLFAGLFLLAAVALALLVPEYLSRDLWLRLLGVLMGTMVVIYANAAPKRLPSLLRLRCDPATEQSIRRFAGWSLTFGGVGYAAAWVFAPVSFANPIAMITLASALLLVFGRVAWIKATSRHV
jgi:hypothetical protein